MGMDTEFISEASGLEAEKIEEIKRKLMHFLFDGFLEYL